MVNEKLLIDLWSVNMNEVDTSDCTDVEDVLSAVISYLSELPTVDAVEVVRCKDCKYWKDSWVAPDGKHEHGYCHMEESDDVVVGRWDDDFCSYGERRTDD